MPRYLVTIREVHTQMVEVDAADADAAKEAVRDGGGTYLDNTLEYSHTLDPETWTAEHVTGAPGHPPVADRPYAERPTTDLV
jgi:hypothetical protein